MTRAFKIVLMAICAVVIVSTLLIGSCALRVSRYREGFSQVKVGQSKETAISMMGKPSESRNCSFLIYNGNKQQNEKCAEIFIYQGIYERWALAFDDTGKTIEKYYWFLDEYGKRPPDVN